LSIGDRRSRPIAAVLVGFYRATLLSAVYAVVVCLCVCVCHTLAKNGSCK